MFWTFNLGLIFWLQFWLHFQILGEFLFNILVTLAPTNSNVLTNSDITGIIYNDKEIYSGDSF